MKRHLLPLVMAMSLLCGVIPPVAAAPYRTYTYVNASDGVYDVAAPAAYIPTDTMDANELGVTLSSPEDLYADTFGNFYIVDKGENAVYVFSSDWHNKLTLSAFTNKGKADALNAPEGVCVDSTGNIWVADTGNRRLVQFDAKGALLKVLEAPNSTLLSEEFQYEPIKLAVDDVGRIFVVCRNVFDGLVQLTLEGDFSGFVGSNYSQANWYEQFWQAIMTDEQSSKRTAFIPMEYANICMDHMGFLYVATAVSNVDNPVRRLNPSGEDILVRNAINGIKKVSGDLLKLDDPSSIVDIALGDTDIYYALDGTRGRVFAYDEDGNMLFVFGGINTYQKGTFHQPCSLIAKDDVIYVLDRDSRSVTVFSPTAYAKSIYSATRTYCKGDYERSLSIWEDILKQDSNFDLAYDKAGFCLYRMQNYKKAMDYFSIANDRESYSMAMVKYRHDWINDHFTGGMLILLGVIVALIIVRCVTRMTKRKRKGGDR